MYGYLLNKKKLLNIYKSYSYLSFNNLIVLLVANFLISPFNFTISLTNFDEITCFDGSDIKKTVSMFLFSCLFIPASWNSYSKSETALKPRNIIVALCFKHNDVVLKKLGRINSFLDKDQNKPSATFVASGDIFKVYFEESVDLKVIKENLLNKQEKYQNEIEKINSRLNNKDFVKRAPKHIVDQEKTNYNNLKNDIKKISLTIKSL